MRGGAGRTRTNHQTIKGGAMSDQLTLSNTGTRAPRALQVAALPQKLRLCAMRGGLVWSNSASRARNRLRIESDQLRLQGWNGASSTLRVTFIYRCPAVRRALSFRAIPRATSILLRERPPAASLRWDWGKDSDDSPRILSPRNSCTFQCLLYR